MKFTSNIGVNNTFEYILHITVFFRHRVWTGSGVHLISYQMGTGGFFLGVQRPVLEADYSPPSSAEVKNA
jgi:hypothetical protein